MFAELQTDSCHFWDLAALVLHEEAPANVPVDRNSYNQEWYSITRLATALFCTKLDSETLSSFVNLSEELWGSTERHYLIDQWARSIMSGSGEVEDEDLNFRLIYMSDSVASLSLLSLKYLSETMGAAEPTKLDDEYNEMERKVDTTYELITSLIADTHEYLQPNPATRAKMATMGALSKVRGTTKASPYPQTEGVLAETMQKYGTALGNNSDLGKALLDASEAYRQMADIKYQMEDNVKHNFLDPLAHLQQTDLKEVNHHRTKLKGRRLDYDCKKRKQTRDEELIQAEEKLEESKRLAEQAMYNLLSNDVEQVSQLCALVDAQLDFHHQTTQVLERLQQQLRARVNEATSRPRTEHIVKPVLTDRTPSTRSPVPTHEFNSAANINFQPTAPSAYPNANGGDWSSPAAVSSNAAFAPSAPPAQAPPPAYGGGSVATPSAPAMRKPTAKALYDFEAQNEGELDFKEGDLIELTSQIDENWYEGSIRGKSGFFPISYVQVLVPL
ncbi:Endophilin-A2 [Toxocara canis]|uniref:Endophilin-A2 n=1 Tax=Toxocara canis TaxID=6265 RepID=A0A0B2V8N3_TOXCA|nr:Endophilin-A2 [Toxocara canis]